MSASVPKFSTKYVSLIRRSVISLSSRRCIRRGSGRGRSRVDTERFRSRTSNSRTRSRNNLKIVDLLVEMSSSNFVEIVYFGSVCRSCQMVCCGCLKERVSNNVMLNFGL